MSRKVQTPYGFLTVNSEAGERYAELFVDVCRRQQEAEQRWISKLILQGVVAIHPDDGWVNRERNEVYFCYPRYMKFEALKAGAMIALGNPEKYRLCRITGRRDGGPVTFGMIYWSFEEVECVEHER